MLHRLILGFLILVATANAEPPDPVQSFDALLKEATTGTTTSTPTCFNPRVKQWCKYRFRINDLKMDVRKTDSLVTPLLGLVSFTLLTENTHFFPTEQQAKAAEFEPEGQDVFAITLRYGFKDGAWLLLDGTYSDSLSAQKIIRGLERTRAVLDGTYRGKVLPQSTPTMYTINDEKLRAEPYALPFAALLNWRPTSR